MGNDIHKLFQGYDVVDFPLSTEKPHYKEHQKTKQEMSPTERVKHLFSANEYGELTPELMRVKDTTTIAMLVGGIFGGVGRSRIAYQDFFKANVHTAFETPFHARRQLQDKVILGFASGFARVGWRVTAFTAMFSTISTVIAAYRGKSAILDQMGGGAAAGLLYKLREGPKSMVVGTGLGSALGFTAGILSVALTMTTGLNVDDFIQKEYEEREAKRMDSIEKARLKYLPYTPGRISSEELHKLLNDTQEGSSPTITEPSQTSQSAKDSVKVS